MPYITLQDMIDQFGEREMIALSDRMDAGEVDPDVVARAIATATSEVDAYVAAKAAIPLSSVSPIVNRHCCNLARFHLVGAEAQSTEEIRTAYEDAVKFFRGVGEGKVQLGVDGANQAPAARGTVVFGGAGRSGQGGRVFSRDGATDII